MLPFRGIRDRWDRCCQEFFCHEKFRVSLELLNLFCKISEKYLNIYCIYNIFILGKIIIYSYIYLI